MSNNLFTNTQYKGRSAWTSGSRNLISSHTQALQSIDDLIGNNDKGDFSSGTKKRLDFIRSINYTRPVTLDVEDNKIKSNDEDDQDDLAKEVYEEAFDKDEIGIDDDSIGYRDFIATSLDEIEDPGQHRFDVYKQEAATWPLSRLADLGLIDKNSNYSEVSITNQGERLLDANSTDSDNRYAYDVTPTQRKEFTKMLMSQKPKGIDKTYAEIVFESINQNEGDKSLKRVSSSTITANYDVNGSEVKILFEHLNETPWFGIVGSGEGAEFDDVDVKDDDGLALHVDPLAQPDFEKLAGIDFTELAEDNSADETSDESEEAESFVDDVYEGGYENLINGKIEKLEGYLQLYQADDEGSVGDQFPFGDKGGGVTAKLIKDRLGAFFDDKNDINLDGLKEKVSDIDQEKLYWALSDVQAHFQYCVIEDYAKTKDGKDELVKIIDFITQYIDEQDEGEAALTFEELREFISEGSMPEGWKNNEKDGEEKNKDQVEPPKGAFSELDERLFTETAPTITEIVLGYGVRSLADTTDEKISFDINGQLSEVGIAWSGNAHASRGRADHVLFDYTDEELSVLTIEATILQESGEQYDNEFEEVFRHLRVETARRLQYIQEMRDDTVDEINLGSTVGFLLVPDFGDVNDRDIVLSEWWEKNKTNFDDGKTYFTTPIKAEDYNKLIQKDIDHNQLIKRLEKAMEASHLYEGIGNEKESASVWYHNCLKPALFDGEVRIPLTVKEKEVGEMKKMNLGEVEVVNYEKVWSKIKENYFIPDSYLKKEKAGKKQNKSLVQDFFLEVNDTKDVSFLSNELDTEDQNEITSYGYYHLYQLAQSGEVDENILEEKETVDEEQKDTEAIGATLAIELTDQYKDKWSNIGLDKLYTYLNNNKGNITIGSKSQWGEMLDELGSKKAFYQQTMSYIVDEIVQLDVSVDQLVEDGKIETIYDDVLDAISGHEDDSVDDELVNNIIELAGEKTWWCDDGFSRLQSFVNYLESDSNEDDSDWLDVLASFDSPDEFYRTATFYFIDQIEKLNDIRDAVDDNILNEIKENRQAIYETAKEKYENANAKSLEAIINTLENKGYDEYAEGLNSVKEQYNQQIALAAFVEQLSGSKPDIFDASLVRDVYQKLKNEPDIANESRKKEQTK